MMHENNPLFRPPAEADSLILQGDEGCPYNRCTFCGMYREMQYRRRPWDEIRSLVATEAGLCPDAQRVFLADGDVMRRSFQDLQAILTLLNERLPRLARVSLYANGSSIAAKSEQELCVLRAQRLHTLYMGLESGDEDVLKRCRKAETAEQMVDAAVKAQGTGLRMSVMVLLGLGGVEHSEAHAACTADALNRMQPRLLSILRVVPVPGTELGDEVAASRFRPLTGWQVVLELRALVSRLDLQGTVFCANHSSNVLPLEGRLPRDKELLLAQLDALLDSDDLDRQTPGRMPLWL